MPYLSASAVVIHYEEALYQVYALLPLPFTTPLPDGCRTHLFSAHMYIYKHVNARGLAAR